MDIKKNVFIQNTSLDGVDTKEVLLSIGLSANGFIFSVLHQSTLELLLLGDYSINFEDSFNDNLLAIRPIFEEHKLTTKYFPNKRITVRNNRFALLPDTLFDKSQIESCLQIMHGTAGSKVEEYSDSLPSFAACNIYDIPVSLLQATRIIFPSAVYRHHASALLNYAAKFTSEENITTLIEVGERDFYMAVLDSQKLLFCNSFSYQTKEDFIYFILSVFTQLKIDVHTADVFLTGKIVEDSQLFSMLYKYIQKVSLISTPVCKSNSTVPVNQYAVLLQCE